MVAIPGYVAGWPHRVLVGTNMHPGTNISQMVKNPPPTYTEQVQWRDAATGNLLAASDYLVVCLPALPQLKAQVPMPVFRSAKMALWIPTTL